MHPHATMAYSHPKYIPMPKPALAIPPYTYSTCTAQHLLQIPTTSSLVSHQNISYHNSSTMAKLSAVAALLAALLLIAHATAYYHESGESCSKQLQQQQVLNHCQMYLSQQCQSGRFDSNTYDESQRFQLCCRQLKMMDIGCRCDGLNIMMRELMREVPGRREIQKMMQMAQNLPNQCNMKPRRCEMEMLSFRY